MTAQQLFFIRHFAKEAHLLTYDPEQDTGWQVRRWNAFDRTKVSLSPEGKQEGVRLAERFGELVRACGADIRHVFVSPHLRTRQTMDLLRPAFPQARIVLDERLREIDAGIECLQPYAEFAKRYHEYRAAVEESNYLCVPRPFGESHAARRDGDVRSFFEDLLSLNGDACAITHAGIIDLAHQIARGLSDEAVLQRFSDPNRTVFGGVLHCRYDPASGTYRADQDPINLTEPSA